MWTVFREISIIIGYLQIDILSHPEYQKCDFILPNLPEPTKEWFVSNLLAIRHVHKSWIRKRKKVSKTMV